MNDMFLQKLYIPAEQEGAVERCPSKAAGRNHERAEEGGRPKQAKEGRIHFPHVHRTEIIFRSPDCCVFDMIKLSFPGWIQEQIN